MNASSSSNTKSNGQSRISQACESCRRRKRRCDGGKLPSPQMGKLKRNSNEYSILPDPDDDEDNEQIDNVE